MADTRDIENKFNQNIYIPYMTLFFNLSKFVNFNLKSMNDKVIINNIVNDWISEYKDTLYKSIDESIDDCIGLANNEIPGKVSNISPERLNGVRDATKDQLNNLVDYIEKEYLQLVDYIILYGYTSIMVKDYIASLQDTFKNKIELTTTNTTLKNFLAISANLANNQDIKGYIYKTMEDDKVRPTHAVHDGKYFTWDNPPSTGHPGTEINCRCQMIFKENNNV